MYIRSMHERARRRDAAGCGCTSTSEWDGARAHIHNIPGPMFTYVKMCMSEGLLLAHMPLMLVVPGLCFTWVTWAVLECVYETNYYK